ncbi:SDR family oxidoreductase [Haloimpatiens sp. FM7330]|uniref:SDR family oxidoreductase n=1 Tax=Haloimpatiens sp. FM7330 TaxID=3298610 RepID=UPI0036444752
MVSDIEFINDIPPQEQKDKPGLEYIMNPRPIFEHIKYKASNKLENKVAIITGGDSGIGRAVAVLYAKEGADVVIVYLNEDIDAQETKKIIEEKGCRAITIRGDISDEKFCDSVVKKTIDEFGKIDILVNNAAEQCAQNSIEDITKEQLYRTFEVNIFSIFYMTKACLPYLQEGSCIINTSSVTAYAGNERLIDYSSTKGAIVSFTRSLALSLAEKRIRVNCVAPGPIWTPLIPSCFTKEEVAKFGQSTSYKRPGQPVEVAPSFVFLASDDASYITGETIHINGGKIVNG